MKTPLAWRGWALLTVLAPAVAAAQSSTPSSSTAKAAAAPAVRPLWIGVERVNGRPSPLRVVAQPGKDGVQLAFGPPRPCRVTARPTAQTDGVQRYDLIDSSGGRCDRWTPGVAVLRTEGDTAQLELRAGGLQWVQPLWAAGKVPEEVAMDATLSGRWTSVVHTAGGVDLDLSLRLQGREPGDEGSELVYGSPRNCRVPLRYEGRNDAGTWFAVLPGNGGAFCDALVDRWLVISLRAEAASLRIDAAPDSKAINECVPNCSLGRSER
ncbi:hypothetical protein [Stenotrophomonas sp. PS02289]|uniref:hypothetical protein n=1 Tax=Stenotrophomonas sp. PS02289 TaxID=2991422 RepID=UPI00249C5A1A|nr:hypothetical protein [Stenotrophomonas sp. PS02289]